ncbi:hypothetical protein ALC56_09478 [Trachymyrmex septentrionalis]|uniref:Sel1 repeat-containing protein 1 like protein n=1 Tax=Trachymyrmex septentrionalis TaxID=34720 RepID=A0A151JUD8_9HYME|nr:hypothetical protein ALC56_09478 [Trachymyrmex septentrionalis]
MAYNLKNEEELKEYLKNLHIEYQFGCFSEKNPEVCHLLGDFYEAVKLNTEKAALLYKTTCDQYNYARSCAKFGDFKVVGKGCEKDIPTAYKYLSKGCELNDEYGCLHAGVLGISKADVGEKDRATQIHASAKYLKKACDMYSEKACFYLSCIYLEGLENFIKKDYKEAYKLSLKSCELGNPYACANLSQMHLRGEGAQKNPELATTFKKRAIDLHENLTRKQQELKFHQGIDP